MAKLSDIGKSARASTNKAFEKELSSLTKLSDDEIQNLFPEKADKKELEELLKIVNLDINDKEKKIKLIKNIEKVGGAIIKIGKKFIAI